MTPPGGRRSVWQAMGVIPSANCPASWQRDTELIRKRSLEIWGYPEGACCYGVVVKWPALVVIELPPIKTV
jgi:hypothetical protein